MKAVDAIGAHDDAKLPNAYIRDVVGTAAMMVLQAEDFGHEPGRILVRMPFEDDRIVEALKRLALNIEVVVFNPATAA